MWSRADIRFEMLDDLSDDGLVTLRIVTPVGIVLAMGEPSIEGRILVARGVHMHGIGLCANELGPVVLRMLADAFLAEMDLDGLVIEGAIRTTGANPGARPRPIRFARRARAEAGSGS